MPTRYKLLITGSSGMLGVDLCQELAGDYVVMGTDLVERRASYVKSFYKCDITDAEAMVEVIAKAKPDAVIHAAAWTDVDGCELDAKKAYKINSEGARNVASGCVKVKALLIYISTDFVFDGKKKGPYKESDKANPLSIYGDSKLKGEEAIKDIVDEYFIVRTSWLYGAKGKNFVDTILAKAKVEKTLKVVDDQIGSPTYTKDLAKAIHALLDKIFTSRKSQVTSYGIYHVSNGGSVSWYDYAREILNLANLSGSVVPISSQELARPAKRPAMSVMDNSKFIGFTGYRMRHWRDALKDYLASKNNIGEMTC